MARPRKEIDQKNFENLCGLQCTKDEICGFFEITDKTLESWCKRTYKAGFSNAECAKIRLLFNRADKPLAFYYGLFIDQMEKETRKDTAQRQVLRPDTVTHGADSGSNRSASHLSRRVVPGISIQRLELDIHFNGDA